VQSGPSSQRAAGFWLATALPLTAERAVSAIGFKRGNEGVQTREEQGSLIKKMNAFLKATALGNECYNCEKMFSIANELISHFRFYQGDNYQARSACRHLGNAPGKTTPAQELAAASYNSTRISTLRVPSATNASGHYLRY